MVKAAHNRAARNAEQAGDVRVGTVLEVFQREDLAECRVERCERGPEFLLLLLPFEEAARLRRNDLVARIEPRRMRCGVALRGLLPCEEVQAAVAQDAVEPRVEFRQRIEPRDRSEGARERILTRIERVLLVAEQMEGVKKRLAPIFLHQKLESDRIAMFQAELDGALFVHARSDYRNKPASWRNIHRNSSEREKVGDRAARRTAQAMPPALAVKSIRVAKDGVQFWTGSRASCSIRSSACATRYSTPPTPKGVEHRPRAPQRTVMLMVETKGIVPTGD